MGAMHDVFGLIEAGDAGALRELVERDSSALAARDGQGLSPVLRARYAWRTDLLDVLLAAGPELDVFEAAAVGDGARVRELVEADPALAGAWGPDGFTALQLACYFGQPEAARYLLDRGADVHAVARNAMAVQPLHAACASGQVEIARLLLEAGADVNARQHGGYTPLHEAAGRGDEELARVLVERGADPSLRLDDGKTPLELAAEKGHEGIAELLSG